MAKKTDSVLHGSSGSTSRPLVIRPPPVRLQMRTCWPGETAGVVGTFATLRMGPLSRLFLPNNSALYKTHRLIVEECSCDRCRK